MKERRIHFIIILAHALIGIGFLFLYVHHVRQVFENRTSFSQLSKLSREALLRKEDALYFSFYKKIAHATDFWVGYDKLLNLTTVEYPISTNIVKRFHILPEIFIGYLYHQYKDISKKIGVPIVSCWTIESADGIAEPAVICDGLGEPFFFYLEFVWLLGGLTVFVLYMYSSFLSENSFGGIYAVVLYVIFHKNASKIYERPVARENFAFPFILWQVFYLSLCIDKSMRTSYNTLAARIFMIAKLTFLTTVSLLCWQFSSIVYATQILIMIAPWSLGLFTQSWFCIDYTISQFLSTILSYYFMYENKKFFLSWQNGPAFALLCLNILQICNIRARRESQGFSLKNISLGLLMACSWQGTITDILEKSGFTKTDDNPYSVYRDLILHWTFQRKSNFSTTLLACNSDFADIKIENYWELLKTLFVKPYCLYGVVLLAKFLRKKRAGVPNEKNIDQIERAKKYALEDFLEENRISMQEMSNKDTEKDLAECLNLLAECNYDYEKYKEEKNKIKISKRKDHESFFNDVKKLKEQISENEKRKEEKSKDVSCNKIKTEEKIMDEEPEPEPENPEPSPPSNSEAKSKAKAKESKTIKHDDNFFVEYGYHYLYSVAQLVIFTCIGLSIKKLFFLCYTQGCCVAPTLCSKFWYKKQKNIFWTVSFVVFLTSIIDPGIQNLQEEYLPAHANADSLENMLEWININTEKDSVFGGPVEIIATVHLATNRPIVNHAHIEMKEISDRTEVIYSVFSRQQSSDIYNQYVNLKIQYLIISFEDCTNTARYECDILAIWDDIQPTYRKYQQFCAELANKNIPSFLKVFSNKHYGIVKMFSQSVQLNLKLNKLPEKGM